MARSRYPSAPQGSDSTMRQTWGDLVRELESRDARFYAPGDTKWVIVNASITTSINVSTATDTYTANILATLLTKLADKGII